MSGLHRIWVFRRHAEVPRVGTGWQRVFDHEKEILLRDDCAQETRHLSDKQLRRIQEGTFRREPPPKVEPEPVSAADPEIEEILQAPPAPKPKAPRPRKKTTTKRRTYKRRDIQPES